MLAYSNTPRLNSYLRALKTCVESYGGSCEMDTRNKYFNNVDYGIPLDGKIIYQEDIDEGRICLEDIL